MAHRTADLPSNNQQQKPNSQSPQESKSFIEERMRWAVSMFPLQLRPSLESQANYTVEWLVITEQIGPERFSAALVQAVREAKYFPMVGEIRKCAGLTEQQEEAAGGDAAWLWLKDYLRKWPDYGENIGRSRQAPPLPPRIAHAVRLVGGLRAIEFVVVESEPFVKRDFVAAWKGAPESGAAYNELQIAAPILPKLLAATKAKPAAQKATAPAPEAKQFPKAPTPLTDAEYDQRQKELERQKKILEAT